MYKYLILFVMFSLLIGCNESSLEPEDENIQPENVSFGGDNSGRNQEMREERIQVPVNPGREQNIFEDANPNQWFRQGDGNDQTNPPSDQQGQEGSQGKQQPPNRQNQQNQESANQEQNNQTPSSGEESLDQFRQKVIELTNEARSENGAQELNLDKRLADVAQTKSEDMAENNYFSHTSPTYGSPFDMLKQFGVDYTKASENIAAGQQSPESVVQGWLNSEGHRKNLLDAEVTHIGVGYTSDGNYWTQLFIKK
ncbi:CAP domain-containing protein [Gracilibacillus kekensis]|uniref:Uncharacterized protein, YkwD family n=1 Tax=Gracilibacillus kekensis TaxID=1027249 RepID=A0A1M7KYY4_9BACI|nr:CAP domain-containing protein [Gracilibacillus kekensis]SHM70799.1 uncharacterized protein, YkwD family [Gracilibacillus kekensis]